jgi:Protein of unknown function (DUF3800)
MAYQFVAYIDESGDEGFIFPEGLPERSSSKWFVISAIITPIGRDKEIIALARSIRSDLQMQAKAIIHFADLRHDRRVYVVNRIASSWLTVTSVIIHKDRIEHSEIFTAEAFRLYKYAVRLLLERISWFCRDAVTNPTDCQCRLIFEHRKALSYDGLRDYLKILQGKPDDDEWHKLLLGNVTIHWPAIVIEKVEAARKAQYAGLQFADCIASGTRAALERRHGFTEHRYAKMLKPRIYKRGSNYTSYGLKFFPGAIETTDERGHWLRKHFR